MAKYIIHHTQWQEIPLEVHFCEIWSKAVSENYGENFSHLEIHQPDKIRLPITQTGYLSHFVFASRVNEEGTPVDYVHKWLDEAAKSNEWKEYLRNSKQLTLF